MALAEIQRAQVTKRLTAFCDARVPAAIRKELRLGFRVKGGEIVLFEERPAFSASPRMARVAGCQVQVRRDARTVAAVLSAP